MATLFEHDPLVNIAFGSFVLLVLTLGITTACRRRSAAVNHYIWVLGLGGCLMIPIVTLLSPNWTLPLLPSSGSRHATNPTLATQAGTRAHFDVSHRQMRRAERPPASAAVQHFPKARPANPQFTERRSPANAGNGIPWPSLATWLLIAWCVGTAIGVSRQIRDVLVVQRASRQCEKIESEGWCILRDAVARQLGMRKTVTLRSHPGAASPMVVGFLRPVVLLPSDSNTWSLERRRQVLLHELAHVQRRDVLTQSIAGLACAVYWFNPLTWWGAIQMKRLREIACDDVVVTHTTQPGNYAQTLLDVAKDYRCRQRICTVAVARTANVESRIRAILDATRRRASLSKPSARIIGIAALFVSAIVGSMQLASRAADQQETPTKKKALTEESGEVRTMAVRVLDETGRPIPEANVHVSVWELEPTDKQFPNRDFTTNDQGLAEIEIPRRLRILRIWPSKAGYVPQFLNFAQGTHEEGRLIPDAYEFKLQPGHRLSGLVVDVDGDPIANAKVQVKVEFEKPFWGVAPKPIVSTWLANGEDAAVTGQDGRWEITNAPAPTGNPGYQFRLQVTHPEFAGDTRWGELQAAQGITTEQLRAGTAKLHMDRGIAISGSITGPDGKPVTKGLVIWNDEPYRATGVNETQIDASGRYKTKRLAPGDYPLTVVAPDFAPDRRTVQVSQSLQDVDFQLEPGNSIRIKIVDPSGKPIPRASVQIGKWRETEAIYNHKHSNVPESGVPRRADQDGIYTWNWAPADAVEYRISARGYDVRAVTLIAKKEPHRVELATTITIFGKVVDAESGEPIKRFRVIPVKAFRPDFYSTDFQAGSIADGKDGEYTIQIDSYGQTGNRYRVRIEADGYRTALGQKSLALGDAPLEEDFKLQRSPALRGVVLDPSGAQANEFTVAVGTPTAAPHFRIDRPDASFGIAFRVRGKHEFELPATFEPRRIRVFNDSRFAEVLREPDEPIGTITLQPWASVSGRLVQDGKPIPNEWIYFHPLVRRALTEARFQDSFTAKSDVNGHFHFERLPPMSGTVRAHLGPWRDSVLTSSKSVPLDLKPGDRKEISLGGEGASITGRVVATGRNNNALNKNWSLNYLVSRSRGVDYPSDAEPLSFDPSGPLDATWLRQPDFQNWLATRENHFAKLADDGRLRIHGVRPGVYDLVIQLYEQPSGCLVETIGEKVIPLTIKEDQMGAREVEIGDIDVVCRTGPRVGSDMRAFKFTDVEGRVRLINELNGRCVLFHVWASWCKPCLATMPEMRIIVEQRSDDPLTVVGLNIDKDIPAAKALVQEGGWRWAQNYLGDDSDTMRQLGVSSVPAYYLIGPDGKLVGSSNLWGEIEKLLRAELR